MIDVEKIVENIKSEMLAPEIEVKPGVITTLEIKGLFNKNIEASELKRHRDSMLKIFNEHGIEMSLGEDKTSYKGELKDKKGKAVSVQWKVNPLEGEKIIISLNREALNRSEVDELNKLCSDLTRAVTSLYGHAITEKSVGAQILCDRILRLSAPESLDRLVY